MNLDELMRTRFEEDPELKAAYETLEPAYEVARQVIALRRARDLSQAELAALVNTKQSAISRLEAGHHDPSLSTLEKICQALDARLVIQLVPNRA